MSPIYTYLFTAGPALVVILVILLTCDQVELALWREIRVVKNRQRQIVKYMRRQSRRR